MLFKYHAIDQDGHERDGTIEAPSQEVAVSALQRRNLIISAIDSAERHSFFDTDLPFFNRVTNKDVVILSRQIATLFEAQVSALRVFRLLASEVENKQLAIVLSAVGDDLQGGSPISKALSRHSSVFSTFYVNMVRSGEESGKLSETFVYLADYLDRSYDIISKTENALVSPAFVLVVFFGVIALIALGVYRWQIGKTERVRLVLDSLKLKIPYIGDLYKKLYLSRIADNFSTMLLSGVSVVEAIEITGSVVGNALYEEVLVEVSRDVKGGSSISSALGKHPEIPGIMIAMTKVGEETGELGSILTTLAKFYNREVTNAVDTLVGLIEPIMIVLLGLGVGILIAAVLLPIYNLAGAL